MAGVEDVIVEWAPSLAPFADTSNDADWVSLPNWQTIKTTGGQTIEQVTQTFNVGTATIRLRNGDSVGNAPVFTPGTSYKGRNIRVYNPATGSMLFWGRIDRVEFHYDNTPFAAFVTLHCVDTVGSISDASIPDELFPATVDYFTQVTDVATAFTLIMTELTDAVPTVYGDTSHQLVKAPDKFETRQGLLDFLNDVLLTEGAALYSNVDGDLMLRGRWLPLTLLASDNATPILVFTDGVPNPDPLAVDPSFPYRRDDLEWSDADEDFVNSVQTRSKYTGETVVVEDIPTDYGRQQLSQTELVTIRHGWVEANAHMWFTLYNQARAYPKKLNFMVATRGQNLPTVFSVAGNAAFPTFDFQYNVLHTPPGTTDQITYRLAVDYVGHDIDRQRWICTLGFTSLDRWWYGYGNGTDPIDLIRIGGDSDHGIGSTAIIAP